MNFNELELNSSLKQALDNMGFINPTPIQEQSIPKALDGKDILGSAQTGTGKTGAFAIPMIEHLINNEEDMALIMLPTRELACQVLDIINQMVEFNRDIKTALLIGGASMVNQLQQLKRRPRIIVGTPGRINDHISNYKLNLKAVKFLVLDEMDRMLDMGFGIQIEQVIKTISKTRQTLMFSATMPNEIMKAAMKYLNNPTRIAIGDVNKVTENIKQEVVKVTDETKFDELLNQLNIRNGSALVFVKTKHGADKIAKKLNKEKILSEAIHGDLKQGKRQRVIESFKNLDCRVLVATDLASRGLDISHIQSVINYDLPQAKEDYVHRIGRTARAGASGIAINLVSDKDAGKWRDINRFINRAKENAVSAVKDMSDFYETSSDEKRGKRKSTVSRTKKTETKTDGGFKRKTSRFKSDDGFTKNEGDFKRKTSRFKSENGFAKRNETNFNSKSFKKKAPQFDSGNMREEFMEDKDAKFSKPKMKTKSKFNRNQKTYSEKPVSAKAKPNRASKTTDVKKVKKADHKKRKSF
ncbi:MAG: ATP-dependent RNA helicase RhlE [Alphaproteobacteria bacterium ADurb.Bin438]|nr:MAG: ATP-dependent RNA helicase RhlE [Alphaproteobacteria bacterium ADurb.Bin438]